MTQAPTLVRLLLMAKSRLRPIHGSFSYQVKSVSKPTRSPYCCSKRFTRIDLRVDRTGGAYRMDLTRRELPAAFLMAIPMMQAGQDGGQHLPSKVYVFDELQVRHGDALEYRQLVDGKTVDGCKFSVHESALQPGHEPHPPH